MLLPFPVQNGKVIHIHFKYWMYSSTSRIIISCCLLYLTMIILNEAPWQEMSEMSTRTHHSPKFMVISWPFIFWPSDNMTGISNYTFLLILHLSKHRTYSHDEKHQCIAGVAIALSFVPGGPGPNHLVHSEQNLYFSVSDFALLYVGLLLFQTVLSRKIMTAYKLFFFF